MALSHRIQARTLPKDALLATYGRHSYAGHGTYTDCYGTETEGPVGLPAFVYAFYTTPVFRLERAILKCLANKPSTDGQARRLADGAAERFAAWHVEERTEDQLLMCDHLGRTRSWFMVRQQGGGGEVYTTLLFGSAVVPRDGGKGGGLGSDTGFRLLLAFHKLYSKALLFAAKRRLQVPG